MLDSYGAVEGDPRESILARVMFTVPTGPKLRLAQNAAEKQIQSARWAMSWETKRLLMEAADAALEAAYYQQRCDLELQRATIAEQAVLNQQERFKIRQAAFRDVVAAQLDAGNAELAKRAAEAGLDQSQVRLSRALGRTDVVRPKILNDLSPEPLAAAPLDRVLAQARQTAPQLAQGANNIAAGEYRLSLEQWKAIPDFAIGPRYRYTYSDHSEGELGGRFTTDLPVIDRNQGRIVESAAQLKAEHARYRVTEIAALNDVAAAYLQLGEVQKRWDYFQVKIRPLMEATEATLRESLNDRTMTAGDLIILRDEFAKMRLVELELRQTHVRLRTRLELLLECRLATLADRTAETTP